MRKWHFPTVIILVWWRIIRFVKVSQPPYSTYIMVAFVYYENTSSAHQLSAFLPSFHFSWDLRWPFSRVCVPCLSFPENVWCFLTSPFFSFSCVVLSFFLALVRSFPFLLLHKPAGATEVCEVARAEASVKEAWVGPRDSFSPPARQNLGSRACGVLSST